MSAKNDWNAPIKCAINAQTNFNLDLEMGSLERKSKQQFPGAMKSKKYQIHLFRSRLIGKIMINQEPMQIDQVR